MSRLSQAVTPRHRHARIGWGAMLLACIAGLIIMSLWVEAVRNEVVRTERQILALKKQRQELEIEFQSRANQHRLAGLNRVEFGYEAPRADQYLDVRRDLASLGEARGRDAPSPIRVARFDPAGAAPRTMVSPVSGRAVTLAALDADAGFDPATKLAETFGDFLIDASPIRAARAETGDAAPRLLAAAPARNVAASTSIPGER